MTDTPPKPKRRRWRWLGITVWLGLSLGAVVGMHSWMHSTAKQFEQSISIGMSRSQVREAVGVPREILMDNKVLSRWGNAPQRDVHGETWIYFVYPESLHRFVLEFSGDRLVSVQHDVN